MDPATNTQASYTKTTAPLIGRIVSGDTVTETLGTYTVYTVSPGKVAHLVFFCHFDQGTNTLLKFFIDGALLYKKQTGGTGYTNTTPFYQSAYEGSIPVIGKVELSHDTSSNPFSYMFIVIEEDAINYYINHISSV